MDLGKVMMKSLKTLRMTMLRRRGCGGPCLSQGKGRGRPGKLAINTPFARFRKQVFANHVFARFRECEIHVFLHAFAASFANMLSQKCLGLASFRKYDFASFRTLSRIWFCSVSQYFTRFRNLQFRIVSQSFARFRKLIFQGFASVKIIVFSQGFAMASGCSSSPQL